MRSASVAVELISAGLGVEEDLQGCKRTQT
jgi:hypothetical protein